MQPIQTRVESVTLYHRGATVRRVADLDLEGGLPREILVVGLPLSLIDHTVRAYFEADQGEIILSNVRVGLHAPPRATPERPPEQKELHANHKAIALQRGRIEQVGNEIDRLRGFPVLPRPAPEEGKLPTASPMPARFALEQLADEAVIARIAEARTLREELIKLEERAVLLQRTLQLASTASHIRPDELTKSVHAMILARGTTPSKIRLVIEYFTVGARWAPAYQCRMSRDCRQAELQLRALVAQRTAEDWRGATLNLSTASPMSWTELPELSAIRIGKAQPPPSGQRAVRPPPMGADGLFADFDRALARARAASPVIAGWQAPALNLEVRRAPMRITETASEGFDAPEMAMDDEAEMMGEEELRPTPSAKSMPSAAMAPPPAPPPAQPASRPMKKAASRQGAGGMAPRGDADFGGVQEEASASLDVVLYASLRLSSASEPTRGKLKPVDRRQAYIESLAALRLVATFDVLAIVQAAESDGVQISRLAAPAGTADVRTAAGFYDYVYRTDAAVDIPSDGTFHSVPVGTRTAPGEVLYVTVPREDTLVYRQALVKNPLPSPLLPGPVEVYVAGEYVLTTVLPAVAPGGEFKLSLGVEQAIKVARNAKYREERSGDKVVATNELIHEIDIELVNNLDREVQCEVRERVPQPAADAEVVVEEGPITPAWAPYTQEERGAVIEGGRRWRIAVKPGATQKLGAHYRVKLYANNELAGGNRREA